MTPINPERRLAYRFLTLPFRHQMAILKSLNVLTEDDKVLDQEHQFLVLFQRAMSAGSLGKLWAETEKYHTDPATFNPYQAGTSDGAEMNIPANHKGDTMEPLISISASTLAKLLASHFAFARAEHKRNPAHFTSHHAYKAKATVIEELKASLSPAEFTKLIDRVENLLA